jgi:hypothetical protein
MNNQEIKLNDTKRWFGQHLGVRYEINNFKRQNLDGGESDYWTYYLFINLSKIPKENKIKSLWLRGEKTEYNRINYKYYKHFIINNIDFHGGCTWYSKEYGFDGHDKIIKIGCDYQHSWDEGISYFIEEVSRDAKNSIDKFINFIPNYNAK